MIYLACHCGARDERETPPTEPVVCWAKPCTRTMHEYEPPAVARERRTSSQQAEGAARP